MKKHIETTLRVLMLVIFIFNLVVPSPAAAQAMQPAGKADAPTPPERTLPAQPAPLYYTPPQASATPAATPTPRVPAQPAVQPVALSMSAQPGSVPLNSIVTITVTLRNTTAFAQTNISFSDSLEAGLEYIPSSGSTVSYDSQKREVTYALASLTAGTATSFSYQLRVTAAKQNGSQGGIRIHTADLGLADGSSQTARVSFGVGTGLAAAQSNMAALDPAGGWHKLGNVSIYMQPGTVASDSVLVATPLSTGQGGGPALQFKLDVLKTGALARDAQGNPARQEVALAGVSTEKFKKPAFITFDLNGSIDLDNIPAGQSPYVATYDEAAKVWVKVPVLAKDLRNDTLTVQAAHFSTWGAGIGASLPQNGANVMLFDQPFTSLFSGSAQYSIPIWMPAGRNGMKPSVSLSYSSGGYNGVLGNIQAPWVGGGWNIDGTEIVRKVTTSDKGYGYENSFALTVNGTKYDLVEDTLHPGLYATKQSSFLYIRRHNKALGGTADAAPTTGGEWWEVVTTDGTRYRLGWTLDAEQLALMYGYACTVGDPCTTPNGSYATLGYAGTGSNLVALRWRVDRVSDTHGNTMSYTYTEEHPDPASNLPAFDRASYLDTISYTGTVDGGLPGYQVKFELGQRSAVGDAIPTAFNIWDHYDTRFLDLIKVCYQTCAAGGTVIRTYDLGYYTVAAPTGANGTMVLSTIAISGGGFAENSITIATAPSATISFGYQNKNNRAVTGAEAKYPYPRLVQIFNGYGGSLTYTYESDGRGANSWYNWRVATATVDSGPAVSAIHGYTYETPVYSDGDTALAELTGYTNVTDTTYDFDGTTKLLDVKHSFGTADPDTGYELTTQSIDPDGTVLNKTVNSYVTDDSAAPFPEWHYRYLYQTVNYLRSNGALSIISTTRYHNDPATGNLAYREDFKGSSTLYRKQYYEYLSDFSPSVHILNKMTRALVVDAGNAISADTRYHYDGGIHAAPVKGDLTLTQRIVNSSQDTIDTSYTHDQYGNTTGTCAYSAYGDVNVNPTASCVSSSTSYDATLNTYPVTSTNALGNTSSTDYFYTLGIAYHSTDPNGWESTTTYDGLGRTLSTTVPGLSQAGVMYTYPAVVGGAVTAPYSIQMQILDSTKSGSDHYRYIWGIYDGLGRILQSQVQNGDVTGQLLISDTAFNARGAAYRQSTPHYVSATGGSTSIAPDWSWASVNAYDALGRVVQVTAPGNIVTSTQYDGLTTSSFDPNNHQTIRTSDAFGRMTKVQETNEDGSIYATTSYTYDVADRLTQVLDAQNNATVLQYDLLGRKTAMDDPDMGVWSYVYNGLGNLVTQIDAKSQAIDFYYDALNRMKVKTYHTATNPYTSPADPDSYPVTYTYGTDPGEIGMRVGMTDTSGATTWNYSDYGRRVTETRTIGITNPITKSSTSTSDWLGRPLTLVYPDGDIVSYDYNALGQARSLQSSAQGGKTLAELAYNQLGQITTTLLGNGATVTNSYDSQNGTYRLLNRHADMGGTSLMNFSYSYDPAGNITQTVDNKLVETITYQYDSLDRLTFAQDFRSSTLLYRQTYSYDQIGNLLQVDNGTSLAGLPSGGAGVLAADNSPDPSTGSGQALRKDALVNWQHSGLSDPGDTDTPTPTQTATITRTPTPTLTATVTPTATLPPISCSGTGVTREVWTGLSGSTVSSLVTGTNNFITAPNYVETCSSFEAPQDYGDQYGQRMRALLWVETDGAYTFWITGDDSASLRLNSATRLSTTTNPDWSALANGATQVAYLNLPANQREWSKYSSQKSVPITLTAGYYYIEARMKESTNTTGHPDHLAVSWKLNDTSTPAANDGAYIIPGTNLYPAPALSTATPTSSVPTATVPTRTPTRTPSPTITRTPTKTSTPTITKTKTFTPTGPTATKTKTPTVTPTVTNTAAPIQVGYWQFEELSGTAAADSSSQHNDGTLTTAVTHISNGASGRAINLGNTGKYVTIPYDSSLQPTNGLTVSAWVDPTERIAGTVYTILNKGGTNQDYVLRITGAGYIEFRMADLAADPPGATPTTTPMPSPTPVLAAVSGPKLPLDTWSMVTGVYDKSAGLLKLYVNGVLVSSKNVSGTVSYDGSPLYIGYSSDPWVGALDEVRLFKGSKTDSEVAALFGTFATPTPVIVATLTGTPATPTPTSTDLPLIDDPWGNGADGDLEVTGSFNLNTAHSSTALNAGCVDGGDGVAYNVSSLGSTAATLSDTPAGGCLLPNDEIMLINLQDPGGSNYSVGNFEFLRVANVTGKTVAFTTQKTRFYGNSFNSDANLGVDANQQKVMLVRVPNYNDVTVSGTLKASAWDGLKYGVTVFRANGLLSGAGTISMQALGYRANNSTNSNVCGESHGGFGASGACLGGGGAGNGSGGPNAGGGSYGSSGGTGYGGAGATYGLPSLSRLYPGSAGGRGNTGSGGDGGGIVYILASSVNWTGSITSKGRDGYQNNGGGGAGGSIRVEADTITALSSADATGGAGAIEGGVGGNGRIAVYYQASISGVSASPAAYTAHLGTGAATRTPTPTTIATATPHDWGTGADGNITVSGTFNLNVNHTGTRTCADGVAYSVIELAPSYARLASVPAAGCLASGDEFLLVNLQGTAGSNANTGSYELLRVGGTSYNTVYFSTLKTRHYGSVAGNDGSIGVGTGQQNVMLVRVPNYNDVTVNGTLTANAWDGYEYGVAIFRAKGTLSGSGAVSMDSLGYRGSYGAGTCGESYGGFGASGACLGGGAAGNGSGGPNGGGGGYGSSGGGSNSSNGTVYGDLFLDGLSPGSAGGWGYNSAAGTEGGGVVYILAKTINMAGGSNITSKGADVGGAGVPGTGAGGSVRIEADTVTALGTVSVTGGSGSAGGAGGRGRIGVYYWTSLGSHTFNPTAAAYVQDFDVPATPTITLTPTRTLTPTATSEIDSYTKVMLHLDGANASTTFTDVSGKSWSATGNAQIDTATKKYGTGSLTLWGSGDDILTGDSNDFFFSSNDFTIDFWVRFNSPLPASGTGVTLYSQTVDASNAIKLFLYNASGVYKWRFRVDNAGTMTIYVDKTTTISAAVWHHIAVVRSGDDFIIFEDGTQLGTTVTDADPVPNLAASVRIGTTDGTNGSFLGHVDDYRVSKGIARWTANFAPGVTPSPTPTITPTPTPTLTKKLAYTYTSGMPHAVATVADIRNVNTDVRNYTYDLNGNLLTRTIDVTGTASDVTTTFGYNADNRPATITNTTGPTLSFISLYDGDGTRVAQIINGVMSAYFMGGAYEATVSSSGQQTGWKKYYSLGGQTILDDGSGLKYVLTDQQGSSVAVLGTDGLIISGSEQRYLPFGKVRTDAGMGSITQTDFGYTGQRSLASIGLSDFKARFYDASIGRFISPDTIVSNPVNPQTWNRYSYVSNNPVRFTDPSGHCVFGGHEMDDSSPACQSSTTPTPPVITPGPVPVPHTPTPEPTQTKQPSTNVLCGDRSPNHDPITCGVTSTEPSWPEVDPLAQYRDTSVKPAEIQTVEEYHVGDQYEKPDNLSQGMAYIDALAAVLKFAAPNGAGGLMLSGIQGNDVRGTIPFAHQGDSTYVPGIIVTNRTSYNIEINTITTTVGGMEHHVAIFSGASISPGASTFLLLRTAQILTGNSNLGMDVRYRTSNGNVGSINYAGPVYHP